MLRHRDASLLAVPNKPHHQCIGTRQQCSCQGSKRKLDSTNTHTYTPTHSTVSGVLGYISMCVKQERSHQEALVHVAPVQQHILLEDVVDEVRFAQRRVVLRLRRSWEQFCNRSEPHVQTGRKTSALCRIRQEAMHRTETRHAGSTALPGCNACKQSQQAKVTLRAFLSGKPSECHESKASQSGQSSTSWLRMTSSPNTSSSNSPYACQGAPAIRISHGRQPKHWLGRSPRHRA